ncbi:MAG TPA: hypothetical protein VIV40_08055 [Kofleriaceae bacterium]
MLVVIVALAGCSRTFKGVAVQPNPVANQAETLRVSEPITIVRGDMDLEAPAPAEGAGTASPVHNRHYPLINKANFTVVSRDRIRFHVQIDHKWEEYADLNTWEVALIDDKGHRWVPEAIEHANTRIITTMWDREQRSAICDGRGRDANNNCFNTVGYREDGWRRRQTLGSLSVYRGRADFVFYQRDLMTQNVRSLRLVVRRPGEAFEFTWRFQDHVASE